MNFTIASTFVLIIANFIVSYKGFKSDAFMEKYCFETDRLLLNKEYWRLITSGFLHTGWAHLIFNMIGLYAFSEMVELHLGTWPFLLIYFTSLVGGELLSLFVHRNHGSYSAVGASGAVCGIIFASIALFPGADIGFFMIPVSIPAWVYGIVFVLYSIFGIRLKKGSVGHESHLGGAIIGMLVALAIEPAAFKSNYLTIFAVALPAIVFIIYMIARPHVLMIDTLFAGKEPKVYSVDQKYNAEKMHNQKEIDRILDKINRKGIKSLNKAEEEKLKIYSRSVS